MPDSSNLEIKDNQLIVNVNPKVYPLEAVYSAAYVFMDRAYIVLDGDPEKQILVKMTLKSNGSLEELGNKFNNELLNYADYLTRAKETKKIREMFLQRAIITNDPDMAEQDLSDKEFEDFLEDLEEDDSVDDPEDIAVPWEEEYGTKDKEESEEKNEGKTK